VQKRIGRLGENARGAQDPKTTGSGVQIGKRWKRAELAGIDASRTAQSDHLGRTVLNR
jgi:hypothetical protein